MTADAAALYRPQTILFVASRASIGGGEVYLFDVLSHLDRSRFTPIVAIPKLGPLGERLAALGVETLVLDAEYGWLKPPQAWYEFLSGYEHRVRHIVDFIVERKIDLVHTNSNQVFEGAVAARLAGVHHVHVVHIPFQAHLPIYQRMPVGATSFARWVDELSSAIVAVAEPVAASLCPPARRDKVHVIHNGLDLDRYRGARAAATGRIRRELGIPADAPLVTGVGRLHPDKGFEHFIDAAAQVAAALPGSRFVIAGGADSAEHEQALKARILAQGLEGVVQLLGFRHDVLELLAESDVFLLTSHSEGGPYVLIEAVATGCGVVATRCGGFVEHVVRPGQTGLLCEPGDSNGAAQAVLVLLRDRPAMARQVQAAQAIVFAGEFDVRVSVGRLVQVYEQVLATQAPAAGSAGLTLLLQMTHELGTLGSELTDLKERMKRVERAADLVLDNPVSALARRLVRGSGGND